MRTLTAKNLRTELSNCTNQELIDLCLRLSRFKKENKELLNYLLVGSHDEEEFKEAVKEEVDQDFEQINVKSYFYIRKSVRKILNKIKKYNRYSNQKETEVELLLYFCEKLKAMKPSIHGSVQLKNTYNRQIINIEKAISKLHEDLQYDYNLELEDLKLL